MKTFLFILLDILIVAAVVAVIVLIKLKVNAKYQDNIEQQTLESFKNHNLYDEAEQYEESLRHIDQPPIHNNKPSENDYPYGSEIIK